MKKLQKLFFATMAILVVLMIAFYDEASMLKEEKLGFRVLESDERFFKNLRQYYYEREWREEAKFELFRFEKRVKNRQVPALNFTIVCNWLHDQAYILPEPLGVEDSLNYSYCILSFDSNIYHLGLANNQENLNAAFDTYQAILADSSRFFLKDSEGWKQILNTRSERSAVKQVLKDFFKLTGAL